MVRGVWNCMNFWTIVSWQGCQLFTEPWMEIYFNSCCTITGGAVFINEHAVAMLRMQESDLMSDWTVNVQALLGPAPCIVHRTDHVLQNLQKQYHSGRGLFWGFIVYAELKRVGMAGVEGEWFTAGWLTAMMTHFLCEHLLQHEPHLNYKAESAKNDCKLGLHLRGKCIRSTAKSTIYIPRVDVVI